MSTKNLIWYSMKKTAEKSAEIEIFKEIGSYGLTVSDFLSQLKALGNVSDLKIKINSHGGDVADGLEIYNALKNHSAYKTTVIYGVAAGIASCIVMAGDTIEMPENAFFHLFNPTTRTEGDEKELRENADILISLKQRMIDIYSQKAKITDEEISKLMDEDSYIDAKHALQYGLIDKVIDFSPDVPVNIAHFKPVASISRLFSNSLTTESKPKHLSAAELNAIQEETTKIIRNHFLSNPNNKEDNMNLHVRADEADKFRNHAVNSMSVAAGVEKDPAIIRDVQQNAGPRSLHGLMRRCLSLAGINSECMNAAQLVSESMHMASTGSSDLPAILANVANRSFKAGYEAAPSTFEVWCGEDTVNDFRPMQMTKLSTFADILDIPEGMEFTKAKMSDKKESVQLSTKGRAITITRQALTNDDTRALTDIARLVGSALRRRINRDVYDVLTSNSLAGPTMGEDNTALFHTNHKNVVANSGVPSVASIGAAEKKLIEMPLMKASPAETQEYANIPAKYIITGTSNRIGIAQIVNTAFDPSKSIPGVYNPYQQLVPVFDAYLQSKLTAANKANAFYVAADYFQMQHLCVVWLDGNKEAFIRSQPSGVGEALGITWDVFLDWAIGVPDWRGIVYSDGAA